MEEQQQKMDLVADDHLRRTLGEDDNDKTAVPAPANTENKPEGEQESVKQQTNNGTPGSAKKVPRKKRKKIPKDALAPKLPLSGYNFFMKEHRELIKDRFPDAGIQDLIRKVAQEWTSLTEEGKKKYVLLAEKDKSRYVLEMSVYKQNKLIAEEQEMLANSEIQKQPEIPKSVIVNGKGPTNGGYVLPEPRTGDYDIPIFTEEFLDHNKALDSELRSLRKSFTDYEQQNSILEKHEENMKNGVEKLSQESASLIESNRILEAYLDKMRNKLVDCFSDIPIPSEPNGASADTIEKYMNDLYDMATSNTHGPACLNKAKDIIRKSDLQI